MSAKSKIDIKNFEFLGDNLLVLELREEDDVLVNPEQYEDKPMYGRVVLCGSDVKKIAVGDTILYGMYSTEKIRNNGLDYYLLREVDVKAFKK